MHVYRSHTCNELTLAHESQTVRLSGWVHRKRDHGNLLFIDLRDHYGLTQIVVDVDSAAFKLAEALKNESVIAATGQVVARSPETMNASIVTGEIEVRVKELSLQSAADPLPLQVNSDRDYPEDIRLHYRYLDLRREHVHKNIVLRSQVISSLRRRMTDQGFMEFQTPILTASSPEGARDFLVPSRIHPSKFYALPQAPQQFKQLLMVAGFDRYFQIAPCFRDEDARADRSPGEFYQLDIEMSFVTQEDIFQAIEPVLRGVFEEFGDTRRVPAGPFSRIPFAEAMLKYGSDKPDLRIPIEIADVSEIFRGSGFGVFAKAIEAGKVVRAVPVKNVADRPRSFFDKMDDWAREQGAPGMGWIAFANGSGKGPIAKSLGDERLTEMKAQLGLGDGDGVFFATEVAGKAAKLAGAARLKLGAELDLIEPDAFRLCWIVDFPMYEFDEELNQIVFSHNPFSMPQGGLEALNTKDPLEINAYQYDIVCNGVELSSGAIRNHKPEIMYRAFKIAGYSPEVVEDKFGVMLNAFRFGAPPHGGIAPGVDRIVMLLADQPNIREVVAFPMNQQAQDPMMNAPHKAMQEQLQELHLRVVLPPQASEVKAEKPAANASPAAEA